MGLFQRKENRTQDQEKSKSLGLSEKVDKLKQEPVKPDTRPVQLRLVVGCGCGGGYDKITREVPVDSDLQHGDYVYESHASDKSGW